VRRRVYLENLLVDLGGKKKDDAIEFISDQLLIRHKDSRIEYTVVKVTTDEEGDSNVICYRYYGPKNKKKMYIKIPPKEYKDYERV